MIVQGFAIGGVPESDESYLRYCEMNCDWTDVKFSLKTMQQKQNALGMFMSSDKWKNTLVARRPAGPINFKEFFSRQIK